jgi:hypothetical protein
MLLSDLTNYHALYNLSRDGSIQWQQLKKVPAALRQFDLENGVLNDLLDSCDDLNESTDTVNKACWYVPVVPTVKRIVTSRPACATQQKKKAEEVEEEEGKEDTGGVGEEERRRKWKRRRR